MTSRKSRKQRQPRESRVPSGHENPAAAQQRRRQLATHYAARYRSR